MKNDWHLTQNSAYYELLKDRLKEEKLIWVKQFAQLINANNSKKKIRINDIGCNVGHFFRAVEDLDCDVNYRGYDISDTYLGVAREHFNSNKFIKLDISKKAPRKADITIISATLEHILDYKTALKNIIETTSDIVLLRTFVGDEYLCEDCLKTDAPLPYTIQQFTDKDICSLFGDDWELECFDDTATDNKAKFVCNENTVLRTQRIFLFQREI